MMCKFIESCIVCCIRVVKSVSQYYIRRWTILKVVSCRQRGGTQHRTFGMIWYYYTVQFGC